MAADGNSYIILNVGGVYYTTSRLTLTSCPDSMLGAMFSEDGVPPQPDRNGHFFIDRDGVMFRYILNFMRDGRLCLPSSFEEYDQLLAEADFFQLSALKEEISSRMKPARPTVEVPAGKETVMMRLVPQPDSVGPEYCIVEAQQQTWAKLKSLALIPPCVLEPGLVEDILSAQEDDEIKAYFETYDVIFCIIRDGFKLETVVPPGDPKCFIFSLDH